MNIFISKNAKVAWIKLTANRINTYTDLKIHFFLLFCFSFFHVSLSLMIYYLLLQLFSCSLTKLSNVPIITFYVFIQILKHISS